MIPPIMLRSTAEVSVKKTSGAYGNVYAEPVKIKCRLERQLRKSGERDKKNINQYIMFCNPHPSVQDEARVVIDGQIFIAEDVQEVPGIFDIDHLEVMLSGSSI